MGGGIVYEVATPAPRPSGAANPGGRRLSNRRGLTPFQPATARGAAEPRPSESGQMMHDFLICVDSDGSAFDTMEVKHKQCFIPNTIRCWGLEPVASCARSAAEFVNLYSRDRGLNRFPALVRTFDLLRQWPEARNGSAAIPEVESLRAWIARETRLGTPALSAEVERTGDAVLSRALEWTEAVNRSVAKIVHTVPPFPFVRESLQAVVSWADVVVCSAEPRGLLEREWEAHGLAAFTAGIAGQEIGSKPEQIRSAMAAGYDPGKVLMIGDAPGDLRAARAAGARFFPIEAGAEQASWEEFLRGAASRFRDGDYSDSEEAARIGRFERRLPETPWWTQ